MKELIGTGVAIVTPLLNDGKIDFKGLENLVNRLIKDGITYIVVLGTTGETATLTSDEKQQVINCIATTNNKRVPLVIGIGGNNTAELIEQVKNADTSIFSAILSVSPYYNKPTQKGIYEHYKLLAKHASLPIILYNVPSRTGSNITAETTLQLATDFKQIIGIKEASGNLEQMMKIIKDAPKDFLVISGDDNLTLPLIAAGGKGVISVTANAFTKTYSTMVQHCLAGNFIAAQKLHYQLMEITDLFFAEGNPAGVKVALKMLNVCNDYVRLPLWEISDGLRIKISNFTNHFVE
jgi:4-hydroxy-tetrahydrodipicolinate synthase